MSRDRNRILRAMDAAIGPDECRVYAMTQCFDTVTKIGITMNLRNRLTAVQTGCPLPVEYVCVSGPMSRTEARALEAGLHEHFALRRMEGEWFSVNPFAVRDHMRTAVTELHE